VKTDEVYNFLAFNGYRIFLLEPPNWNICRPGSIGILSYYDVNKFAFGCLKEAMGFYPGPKEVAEWYAENETKTSRFKIKYRPAFVNDGQYKLLWTNPWYQEKREKLKDMGTFR
jgi:hypothetical protein